VVIPIRPKTKSEERKVYFPLREQPAVIKIRPHTEKFAFGITVHKMQGQTCKRIILDLKSRPFSPQIDYHGLYVALSRVKKAKTFVFYLFSTFKLI
jgi:ATP-dependent exoDNAse (exonuclease V) alpha subunit